MGGSQHVRRGSINAGAPAEPPPPPPRHTPTPPAPTRVIALAGWSAHGGVPRLLPAAPHGAGPGGLVGAGARAWARAVGLWAVRALGSQAV